MKKLLLILLTLCVGMVKVMAVSYTIMTTAQASTSDVQNQILEPNLETVTSLTFLPGSTINSYDIMIIRNRMPNLTYLDMREATIVANDHEYYTGYHSENNVLGPYAFYEVTNLETVILPQTITSIGYNAFGNCSKIYYDDMAMNPRYTGLKKVVFPQGISLSEIGNNAFYNCSRLEQVEFEPGATVETIGMGAFQSCTNLTNISSNLTSTGSSFPKGLKYIASTAFGYCNSLVNLVFPSSLLQIGSSAFSSCGSLQKVRFSPYRASRLRVIGSYAFSDCSNLNDIILPPRLKRICGGAFSGCNSLLSINIIGGIRKIDANAFSPCDNLNDIYPQRPNPIHIDQTTFSTYETANVHLPNWGTSKVKYYWNTEWNQFLNLHSYSRRGATRGDADEDAIVSTTVYFCIPDNTDFEFENGDLRIEGGPDADLDPGSGLIVEGEEAQILGEVHYMGKDKYRDYGYNGYFEGSFSSIIGNNNVSISKMYIDLALQPNSWHFISFPFKVRISDIICKGNFVFRYYDSDNRAQNGTSGWKDLPANEEFLYPGQGYIFQTDYNSNDLMVNTPSTMDDYMPEPDPTISIPIEAENLSFSGADKSITIKPYPSSSPENASWNFMGNPYPCYFDLDETNYEGPITVWNGNGYESVRKGDDVYHFRPLEGFFIQKPENADAMLFQATGRHTYSQWATIQAGKAASRAAEASSRKLINLTLSDGVYTDKTRVVFNPVCTDSYEIGTDASKFIAASKAQLYSLDNKSVRYSINERPVGEVNLGYVATKGGEMTISTSRMDEPVAIYDKKMDIVFDLTKGAYTFATEAGTFNDRFVLVRGGDTTGISTIEAEGAANEAPVYSLDGRRVEQVKANRVYITNGKKVIKK